MKIVIACISLHPRPWLEMDLRCAKYRRKKYITEKYEVEANCRNMAGKSVVKCVRAVVKVTFRYSRAAI